MKKRLLTCGIISIFFLVLITGFALATANDLWAISAINDTEAYSQEIVITENSGTNLTGYQVPINLDSSNFNFSQAKTDGSDLRFFSGGRTLNYWIETWDPEAEKALLWVRIPFLPANRSITLLIKCGNPAAEAVSNGENTFEFFDGFEGDKLQRLEWNAESAGGGLVEVKNGICNVSAPKVHAYDSSLIYSKDSFDINSMFVVKRMKVTTGKDERGPLLRQGFIDQINSRKNEIKHETEFANESRVRWETSYRKERFNSFDLTNVRIPEGEWYTSGIAWYEENDTRNIAWFKNGVRDPKMDYASNDYVTNLPMHVYLYAASYSDASKNTGYMAVDYAFVRKFVEPEPTVRFASDQVEDEISSENILSESDSISESITSTETETPVSEVSAPEEIPETPVQLQENQDENETNAPETLFPRYSVNVSGIKLSSPYRFDFPGLTKDFDSSKIDTIFLSMNGEDFWQYERFVKMAHEEGIIVHAVLFEELNCTEEGAMNTSQVYLDSILDYNEKSLAPFDGINIYMKTSLNSDSEEGCMDYVTLFEAARKKAGEDVSISASLPPGYDASNVEKIAHMVDFFVVRAYDRDKKDLISESDIVDAVALEMGEIRGVNSKGIIEISVEEGFEDKYSIQNLFATLAEYYANDSAFIGVSISNYDTYKALPVKAELEEEKSVLPGFEILSVLLAGLGAFAFLKAKNK
ncbi:MULTISPECIES: DUF2341 domain-containing protein [unclassified Methanosarcina]|uniref:DUF2341 domain-containing protein n=1 Tax=unclassified Methanosarcina TaxID=2644672 RepID=UPI000615BA4B|nr:MULTISPECIES: DUF2341 domain-containing protein [unclassified Methanosarcina]AKB17166.1 hypothetical protein MSWHS_0303 [Methanosarcina sp. WWM596]AKB20572.1 hypothetical protein MSWH1_0301 [Methanosarcina sp. WH1]